MKNCIQDLVKNAIFPHSKYDCMVRNMDMEKQCRFIILEIPKTIFWTFNKLKNVKSTSSMQNILILIFAKHSTRGADNRAYL